MNHAMNTATEATVPASAAAAGLLLAPHLVELGFRRDPFPITPDADGYYFSPRLQGLYGELTHLLALRHGFVLITGDVGVGKTTLQRRLMTDLTALGTNTALIFNTVQQDAALMKAINRDFRIDCDSDCLNDQIDTLNRFLIEQFGVNRNCVLVIDDAQTLDLASLELIRQLSNLETNNAKLLQIVFFAQPEILVTLERHEIRQLRSRINRHLVIDALSREEVDAYLRFRLDRAGHAEALHLTPEALELLYDRSDGNPRRINLIMSRCLFGLDPQGDRRVDATLMQQAIAESELSLLKAGAAIEPTASATPAPARRGNLWPWAVAVAASLLAFVAGRTLAPAPQETPAGDRAIATQAPPASAAAGAAEKPTADTPTAHVPTADTPAAHVPTANTPTAHVPATDVTASATLATSDDGQRFLAAYEGLAQALGSQLPQRAPEGAALVELTRLAAEHGWTPLITGKPISRTCQNKPTWSLDDGQKLAFYRASVATEDELTWFSDSDQVRKLQSQLARHGDYTSRIDGLMGGRTTAAIARFQQRLNLPVNGRLDAATRYALSCAASRTAGRDKEPR